MEQVLVYIGIAIGAILITMLLLLITRSGLVVTTVSGLVVALILILGARFASGLWDPLWPVAFVANALFAFVVSFAFWAIGRWLRWPLFMPRSQPAPNKV